MCKHGSAIPRLTIGPNVGYASGVPSTPPSGASSPTAAAHTDYSDTLADHDLDDEEYVAEEMSESRKIAAKKGGYDSRIQQILYENPNLDIQIVAAGKNTEGGGGYISYTIRTGVCLVLLSPTGGFWADAERLLAGGFCPAWKLYSRLSIKLDEVS